MDTTAKITLTKRMLDKSIIDANKTVLAFAKANMPVSYDDIQNGTKVIQKAYYEDGDPATIRMYRRPRGDELLSIEGLKKRAKVGDVVSFSVRYIPDELNTYICVVITEGCTLV